jgi:hypothetical protein
MRSRLGMLLPLLLLAAAGVRAEPGSGPAPEPALAGLELELEASRALGRDMDEPRCAQTADAKFPGPVRVLGARGEARAFGWLGVFAATRRFQLADDSSGFDVEGGAALHLARGLAVTGGYRVLGLDPLAADASERTASPLLGVRLSF